MSLGETYLTVLGWVGGDVRFKEVGGRTARVSFRVGSTPRHFDRSQGTWIDKPTTWFTVECWRTLAQNVFESVRVGQPVIVSGRLRTNEWTDDGGERRSRVVLEAVSIGHDLSRGTASFTRNAARPEAGSPPGTEVPPGLETTATPYPPQEYSTTTAPLVPSPREVEAA